MKSMMNKAAAAAIAAGLSAGAASAVTFDGSYVIEGGGNPIAYDLGGGEYVALFGLVGAAEGDILNLDTVNAALRTNSFSAIYAGSGLTASEFTDISDGANVADIDRIGDGRVFNAVWGRFYDEDGEGVGFVFDGTATFGFGNAVIRQGNPFSEQLAPVPVPAALPLMAAALGGLGFAGWRRRKSA